MLRKTTHRTSFENICEEIFLQHWSTANCCISVNVYLSNGHRHFPCYPTFQKARLHELLELKDETNPLINAICAVATRFCDESQSWRGHDLLAAGDEFAKRGRSAHVARMDQDNFSLHIDVIKAALLLTLYYCTRYPGLKKGWAMAGETIRLAYELELDKQDRAQSNPETAELSIADKEDRRRLWWSVWKLDIFYSGICLRPFGVDSRGIETCLPSFSYEDNKFEERPPVTQAYLPTNLSKASREISNMDMTSIVAVQRLYLITNSFVREVNNLRRLNMAKQDVNHEMFLLELALSSAHLSMPSTLSQGSGAASDTRENIAKERIRAESVLLLHLFVNPRLESTTSFLSPPHAGVSY